MNVGLRRLSWTGIALCFAAGCAGGLVNSLVAWFSGASGLTSALDVDIEPVLTTAWLYPRIVWGGLWGWLFLLFRSPVRPLNQGAMLSFAPSAVQLFVIFPFVAHKGMLGLDLGTLTPLFVLVFNATWGITTAMLLRRFAMERTLPG